MFNRCKLNLKQTAEDMIGYGNYYPDTVLYYYENCEITRNNNIISMIIRGEWFAGGVVDRLLKTKNYEERLKCLQIVIQLEPENVSGLVALGNVYLEMNNYEEAENNLNLALKIDKKKMLQHLWPLVIFYLVKVK